MRLYQIMQNECAHVHPALSESMQQSLYSLQDNSPHCAPFKPPSGSGKTRPSVCGQCNKRGKSLGVSRFDGQQPSRCGHQQLHKQVSAATGFNLMGVPLVAPPTFHLPLSNLLLTQHHWLLGRECNQVKWPLGVPESPTMPNPHTNPPPKSSF